jgi:hypothetical protein
MRGRSLENPPASSVALFLYRREKQADQDRRGHHYDQKLDQGESEHAYFVFHILIAPIFMNSRLLSPPKDNAFELIENYLVEKVF